MGWDRRWGALLGALALVAVTAVATGCTTKGSGGGSEGSGTSASGAATAATVRLTHLEKGKEAPGFEDETELDRYADDGSIVALVGVSNGVATVRRSADHGRTWTKVKLPDHTYLNTSSTWLRVVGDTFLLIGRTESGAVVSRSTDGGKRWTSSTLPGSARMLTSQDVQVTGDGKTAVILGRFFPSDSGVLLGGWRSADDGSSWTLIPPQTMAAKPVILDRASMDGGAVRAWTRTIVPDRHQLLRSEDGGATWGRETDPPPRWPEPQENVQLGRTWWQLDTAGSVVADVDPGIDRQDPEPRLLRTDDDGATWRAVTVGRVPCPKGAEDPFPRMSVPAQVGALLTVVTSCTDGDADPDHGVTAVWTSADGGDHWKRVAMPSTAARLVPQFPIQGTSTRGDAWFGIDQSDKVIVVETG